MKADHKQLERMHQVIGRLLQVGVGLSAGLVVVGAVAYLFRHGSEVPKYSTFHLEPADIRGLKGIARDVEGLSSRALIQLGIVVLIATPVARVVFSIITFVRLKDWLYTVFTVIVFLFLTFSLFGSK
jgi:uncharacterized membrane protein